MLFPGPSAPSLWLSLLSYRAEGSAPFLCLAGGPHTAPGRLYWSGAASAMQPQGAGVQGGSCVCGWGWGGGSGS